MWGVYQEGYYGCGEFVYVGPGQSINIWGDSARGGESIGIFALMPDSTHTLDSAP